MAERPPSRRRPEGAPNTASLAALGQSAGEVAHDLDNALSAILTHAALLRAEHAGTPSVVDHAEAIIRGAKVASAIVERVRGRLRPGSGVEEAASERGARLREEKVDLEALVDEALVTAQRRARRRDVALARDAAVPPPGPVMGDAAELLQLVLNLVHNAIDASPDGGTVEIGTATRGASALITVRDEGGGIAPELMERIFEPFFTTKGEAGTGLGLPLARAIAEQHGGTLTLRSTQAGAGAAGGTTAAVTLPMVVGVERGARRSTLAATDLELGALGGDRRLLVVDDDPNVREALTVLGEAAGFSVVSAGSLEAALEAGKNHLPDVIVTDLQLDPSVDPRALVQTLAATFPDTPLVVVSGALVATPALGLRPDGRPLAAASFEKPVSPARLIAALAGLVAGPRANAEMGAAAPVSGPRVNAEAGVATSATTPRSGGPDVR